MHRPRAGNGGHGVACDSRPRGGDPLDCGVRVCNGQGNESALALLEALSTAGLLFAGLVDNEGKYLGRWDAVKKRLGNKLHQWPLGCTEQQVIAAIPQDKLPELLKGDEGDFNGKRLRTLAVRLGIQDKEMSAIEAALSKKGGSLRQIIIDAAMGSKEGAAVDDEKEWKSHARDWFKSEPGGRELAKKMIALGAWDVIGPALLPLINAILSAAGRATVCKLDL